MDRVFGNVLVAVGLGVLWLASGFFWQMSWATALWPWADGPLSHTFVASILAAIAAGVIWIGASREWAAMAAGALNLLVIWAGWTLAFALWALQGRPQLWSYAVFSSLSALINLGIYLWARKIPLRDASPLPSLVRVSFGVFGAVLLIVGSALVLQLPRVFPWPLNPDSSVLFGLIFLGDAFYFLYAVRRPFWRFACAPLWSFLAYDVVLFVRFIPHFAAVKPEHRLSLIVYMAVLVYSAGLAVWFLFIRRTATRCSQ